MSPAPGGAFGALEASGLGQAMRQWLWLYPAVEIVHIVGIGLLFGLGAAIAGATYAIITGAGTADVGVAQNPELERGQQTA